MKKLDGEWNCGTAYADRVHDKRSDDTSVYVIDFDSIFGDNENSDSDAMQNDDGKDEVPQDIHAFFGHPLTVATASVNGHEDTSASALALLHEYQNLPAIDKSDIKIGDRYEIADILRADFRKDTGNGSDSMMLLGTDVDTFLSCDQVADDLSMSDEGNLPQHATEKIGSSGNSSCGILGTDAGKHASTDDPAGEFSAFDTTGAADALTLAEDIKSDIMADVSSAGPLPSAESIIGLTVATNAMSVLPINGDMMWQMAQTIGQSPPVGSLSNNHLRAALSAPAQPTQLPPTYPARRRRPVRQRSPARGRCANRASGTQGRLKPTVSGTDLLRGLATAANCATSCCPPMLSTGTMLDTRDGAPSTLSAPGTPTVSTDVTRQMAPMSFDEKPLLTTTPQNISQQALQQMTHSSAPGPLSACNNTKYMSATDRQLSMRLNTHPASSTAMTMPDAIHMAQQPFLPGDTSSQTPRPHSQPCIPRDPFAFEMPGQGAPSPTKSHSQPCTPQSVQYDNVPNFTRLQTAANFAQEQAGGHPGPQPLPLLRPRSPTPCQKLGYVHQVNDRPDTAHRYPFPDLRPNALPAASITTNTLTYGARAPNTEVAMSRPAKHPLLLTSASIAPTVTTDSLATAPDQTLPATTEPTCPQNQQWPMNCTTRFQTTQQGDEHQPPPSFDALPRAHCLPPPPRYPPMYVHCATDGFAPRFAIPTAFIPAPNMQQIPLPDVPPQSPDDLDSKMSTSSLDDDDSKPSESTKKIIQALTEKIRRNQQQRQTSSEHDVSFLEINDIIRNSLGHPPGDATVHDDVMMPAKMESPHTSPQSAGDAMSATAPPPWPAMPARSPADAFPQWAKTTGTPFGHPLPPGHNGQTQPEGAARGSMYNAVDLKRVVVIKPQTYQQQNRSVRSPDSGFNENCISPSEGARPLSTDAESLSREDSTAGQRHRSSRRRRPSTALKQPEGTSRPKRSNLYIAIPKREEDLTGYNYSLESPISTSQRIDEDRMTYLNKGQFYGLVLQHRATNRMLRCNTVKSVISVVFRDEKSVKDSLQLHEFWHSRQHSAKQRILDIDTKNCTGVLANCVDEVAHNAVAIRWNPREDMAKVNIAINCLSTDFSNQKGVKGLPLHIQIDSFEDSKGMTPVHRGYCQVKIFCDKGAERKTRDEERRKELSSRLTDARKRCDDQYHKITDRSEFYSMSDLTTQPVLFNPVPDYEDYCTKGLGKSHSIDESLQPESGSNYSDGVQPAKRRRLYSNSSRLDQERVLLYVREDHETVFTALLLRSPTMDGLTRAIEEKYNIPSSNIRNIYKRSHKGVLVRMDHNIIQHYSNESTFVITIKKSEETHESQLNYDVILSEIDAD